MDRVPPAKTTSGGMNDLVPGAYQENGDRHDNPVGGQKSCQSTDFLLHSVHAAAINPELPDGTFKAELVEYVRLVTSLIEGRRVSRDEVLLMLKRTLRQHGLARERRIDYVLRTLREKPP